MSESNQMAVMPISHYRSICDAIRQVDSSAGASITSSDIPNLILNNASQVRFGTVTVRASNDDSKITVTGLPFYPTGVAVMLYGAGAEQNVGGIITCFYDGVHKYGSTMYSIYLSNYSAFNVAFTDNSFTISDSSIGFYDGTFCWIAWR